jgi:KDO2-lipid IV(A) lauroyltransferase
MPSGSHTYQSTGSALSWALLHPRYWLTWLWMLLLFLMAQLPFCFQLWLGRCLGRLLYRVMKRRRYIAERNIELCFPELSLCERECRVKQHFESNGMAVFETGMAWFMPYWRLRKRFTIQGEACWRSIQAKGSGALIMAVHFTTLEITNVAINRLFNMSMSFRPHNNLAYDFVQRRGRERHNHQSTVVDRNDVRGMVKAMKRGEWLWYAADQDYGPRVSEFLPWFGIDAAMVSAPPRLASMAGVPIVGISYRRLPDYSGYEITFLPAFDGLPSGDHRADLLCLSQHYEQCVRANPVEYLWVHRRFKTRPEGEPVLYEK